MKFSYDLPAGRTNAEAEENYCAAREPNADELISIQTAPDGSMMVAANKQGWIYLAKTCVEMAHTFDVDPGYHFHRTANFSVSNRTEDDKIGFFHIADDVAEQIRKSRQR